MSDIYTKRLKQFIDEVSVYPVSCEKLANGRTDIEWLEGVLAGGARIVQLRDKESSARVLLEKAKIFRRMTQEAGALFIVNDRLDIALLADADGIHVGNSDIPPEEIRRLAPEMIIGISCNTEEQAKAVSGREASYYNIGPIFSTKTKAEAKDFLGPEAIGRFSAHSDLPFTVMGGIKKEHIKELTAHGAQRLAVVTAISQAEDIAAETSDWVRLITQEIKTP